MDCVFVQLLSSMQKIQFNHERDPCYRSPCFFHEFATRGCSASGRQQVIYDQHAVVLMKCILVNLQYVLSVFKFIICLICRTREFSRFSDRNESALKTLRDQAPKNKATSLYSRNSSNALFSVGSFQTGNRILQNVLVRK